MNRVAIVVNMFLILRVCLVGGILLMFARIARKGLMFGVYVGEEFAEGETARGLRRSWDRSCLLLMAVSLLVGLGISVAGWPVTGNLTGTAVLLSVAPLLYLRMYRKVRKLTPPDTARQAGVAVASLGASPAKGTGFAVFALCACLVTSLTTVVYAATRYEFLPERIPTLSNMVGVTEEWADRSFQAILFLPLLSLLLGPSFALMGLLIARAKRSVRGGTGGRSAEAQDAFRVLTAFTFSGMALFVCLELTVLSVRVLAAATSDTPLLGGSIVWISLALILFALTCLVRIFRVYGQGGALLEEGSPEARLTDGLADNRHWIWGVIYVDREDPSLLVESRFGIGYTMNFGNRTAVLLAVAGLAAILGLVVLALTGTVF